MTTPVRFRVDDAELERINERAEKADLNRAEYIRQRFRAGELLWRSGELDAEVLKELGKDGDLDVQLSGRFDRTGENQQGQSKSAHPVSPNQDLTEFILPEIPHKDSGDGISEEELKEVIFGSKDEREEAISQVIEKLYDEKITRRADGLLVRIGDGDA